VNGKATLEMLDVIIPFHRNDELLLEAIKSTIANLPAQGRVIAVNDSGLAIEKNSIGLRSSDILIESNGTGYLAAMDTGVRTSTAEFVSFLDSDDICGDDRFAKQINRLVSKSADYCSGTILKISPDGSHPKRRSILGSLPDDLETKKCWFFGAHRADSSIVIRGDLVRRNWVQHGNFPPIFADYGFALSLPPQTVFTHEEHALYLYRAHPSQMSRARYLIEDWQGIHKLWLKNYHEICIELKIIPIKEISQEVTLSIAFPASRTKLSSFDRKVAIKLLEQLRQICKTSLPLERHKQLDSFLNRRGFLISPFSSLRYVSAGPNMLIEAFLTYIVGIKPRITRG
jgi:glycosyltransferase involved in cell wall biosynthesis